MSNLKKAATTVAAKAPAAAAKVEDAKAKVEEIKDKAGEVKQDIEAAIQAVKDVGADLPENMDGSDPKNLKESLLGADNGYLSDPVY